MIFSVISHSDWYAELGGAEPRSHLHCWVCMQVRQCQEPHIYRTPMLRLLTLHPVCSFFCCFFLFFVAPWRAWQTAACISKTSTASSVKPLAWRNRLATLKGAGRRQQLISYFNLVNVAVIHLFNRQKHRYSLDLDFCCALLEKFLISYYL